MRVGELTILLANEARWEDIQDVSARVATPGGVSASRSAPLERPYDA